MQLALEIEGTGVQPPLPGDGSALVAFMSFAVVRGFGAQHPYIALADRLHEEHGVRLGPLTTFYEGRVEDAEDEEKLEMAWQPAGELRESLEAIGVALESGDPQVCGLLKRAGAEQELPEQVRALAEAIEPAAEEGRRVRLSYTL